MNTRLHSIDRWPAWLNSRPGGDVSIEARSSVPYVWVPGGAGSAERRKKKNRTLSEVGGVTSSYRGCGCGCFGHWIDRPTRHDNADSTDRAHQISITTQQGDRRAPWPVLRREALAPASSRAFDIAPASPTRCARTVESIPLDAAPRLAHPIHSNHNTHTQTLTGVGHHVIRRRPRRGLHACARLLDAAEPG